MRGKGQKRLQAGLERHTGEVANTLALAQGGFYLVTGLWPIIHINSFERITGPKTDRWLVKTTGTVIAVAGTALALAGLRRRVTPEIRLLAMANALGLTAIDLVYVAQGRILRVYLLDAIAELGLAAIWLGVPSERPANVPPSRAGG